MFNKLYCKKRINIFIPKLFNSMSQNETNSQKEEIDEIISKARKNQKDLDENYKQLSIKNIHIYRGGKILTQSPSKIVNFYLKEENISKNSSEKRNTEINSSYNDYYCQYSYKILKEKIKKYGDKFFI